jgi:cholesterol transport system auxiliary component
MKALRYALPALALAGCSFGGKPPKQLLALTPPVVQPNSGVPIDATRSITVITPAAAAVIAGPRVPVYEGPNAFAYVKDARWVEPPARQFQSLLTEALRAKGGRLVLDARQTTVDPGARLGGSLIAFGIDATTSQAVVTYDAIITRGVEPSASRRFEARVPVTTIDARGSAAALDKAANQVASEVADWVN